MSGRVGRPCPSRAPFLPGPRRCARGVLKVPGVGRRMSGTCLEISACGSLHVTRWHEVVDNARFPVQSLIAAWTVILPTLRFPGVSESELLADRTELIGVLAGVAGVGFATQVPDLTHVASRLCSWGRSLSPSPFRIGHAGRLAVWHVRIESSRPAWQREQVCGQYGRGLHSRGLHSRGRRLPGRPTTTFRLVHVMQPLAWTGAMNLGNLAEWARGPIPGWVRPANAGRIAGVPR